MSVTADEIRSGWARGRDELVEMLGTFGDETFRADVPSDGRTVCQLANHVIDAWLVVVEGFQAQMKGEAIPEFTDASVDARNARHAESTALYSPAETLAALHQVEAQLGPALEFLSEPLLNMPGPVVRGAQETIGELVFHTLVEHNDEHLAEIRAVVGTPA